MLRAPGAVHAIANNMSGHKQHKKDHARKEHAVSRRRRDLQQPVARSVPPERGQATSNFTDGDIAGADHKHDSDGHLKRRPAVSEPLRRR
jgi:hypothetical protein